MATITADEPTTTLSLHDAAITMSSAGESIRMDMADADFDSLSPYDQALAQVSSPDVGVALIDTLRRNNIDSLEVDPVDLQEPGSTLYALMKARQSELVELGMPDPDIDLYRRANEISGRTGEDYIDVVTDLHAAEPLAMRSDLGASEDVAGMDIPDLAHAVTDIDGPVGEVAEYDVHFMGYPILYDQEGLVTTDSQFSYAFVVVTRPDGDPLDRNDVEFATRAGPDDAAGAFYSPDSSLPEGEQSQTDKENNGNIYVSTNDQTLTSDIEHDGAFHVHTTMVTGDLNQMRTLIDSHRSFINGQDIDYETLNRNSNTYADDAYMILTGEEPPNFEWSRMNLRYFPAQNNDLTEYRGTQFEPYMNEDTHPGFNTPDYVPSEEAGYGMD